MSYLPNTAFEARITNNDRDNLANIAGLYQVSDAAADCSAGLLCVRNGLVPCEGFPAVSGKPAVMNENTWYMNAATAATKADDVVYACNTYDNQLLPGVDGNAYFIGTETLGLGVPAGRYGNFTRINFDGQSVYRFGEGNVTVNTAGDKFFTITAGGLLTSATAKPTAAGTIYFELRGTGKFIAGTQNSFGYYDLVACKVTVAPAAA